jgi:hypothetical protein
MVGTSYSLGVVCLDIITVRVDVREMGQKEWLGAGYVDTFHLKILMRVCFINSPKVVFDRGGSSRTIKTEGLLEHFP